MTFRVWLFIIVGVFLITVFQCARAADESSLAEYIVERDGVSHQCALASLADQSAMPREQLPRHLRVSCTDGEIMALARGCVEFSVNGIECSVGMRLHVAIDKYGTVIDIFLVDDVTGEQILAGRILN